MDRFYRLLAFGYLPKELPPVFHSGGFAKEIKRARSRLNSILGDSWSRPCRYLLQQRRRYRRPLSILNPNAMIPVANIVASDYSELIRHTDKSHLSVSRPRFRRKTKFFRAVSSEDIGDIVKEKKLRLRASYPMILKCDVKNYYRSVYTHSIPWAIHGKEFSKRHQREQNLGNLLDNSIRLGQDGQTIGIPVGPDTSFIMGEVLLASVDESLGYDQTKAIRFYDDYEFGCKSEIEAEQIIDRLEKVLSDFELELNHEKTRLIKGPEELEGAWTQFLKDYTERKKIKRSEDLIDLFNLASKLAKDNDSDFVFKYFMRRMLMTVLDKKHWNTWQNVLFSAAFCEFGNLRELYEQLDLYQRIGYRINRKGLRNLLETKAANEVKGGVSSELSWIMFGFLKFKIKPDVSLLESVIIKGDDISKILAIKIATDNDISIRRKIRRLLDLLDGGSALSEHWLLFWELYVNEWITDSTLKSELLAENIFQFLDSTRVTFLREPLVDLLEVPRSFRERIQQKKGSRELQALLKGIESTFRDLSEEEESLELDVDELTGFVSDEEEVTY